MLFGGGTWEEGMKVIQYNLTIAQRKLTRHI
jgi:hypothetical protein